MMRKVMTLAGVGFLKSSLMDVYGMLATCGI